MGETIHIEGADGHRCRNEHLCFSGPVADGGWSGEYEVERGDWRGRVKNIARGLQRVLSVCQTGFSPDLWGGSGSDGSRQPVETTVAWCDPALPIML